MPLPRALTQPRARWITTTLVVVAAAAFMTRMPTHASYDDDTRRQAVLALVDGHWSTMKYSMVMPLLAVVPYRLAQTVGQGDVLLRDFNLFVWVAWSLLVGWRLSLLRGARFAAAVVTLSSVSMLAAYITTFNAEALSLMMMSAGLLLLVDEGGRGTRVAGVVLTALGAAVVPVQVVGIAVVGAVRLVRRRDGWVFAAAVLAVTAGVIDVAITQHQFGFTKYSIEGTTFEVLPWGSVQNFGYPFVFGLLAILFSFGRGLVWYMPSLFLHDERRHDPVDEWRRVLTILVLVMVPIYAKWWSWYGGVSFGPRFFLLGVVPAAVALCDRLRTPSSLRAWAIGVAVTAFTGWIAIAGAVYSVTPQAMQRCTADEYRLEVLCWHTPEYSSLWAPLWAGDSLGPARVLFIVGVCAVVAAVVAGLTPTATWHQLRTRVRTLGRTR
ncbi:MAG: hypothetical protein Q7V57_19485 [Actinomycetota bacterium]|nr:hypothetical protein [Actinomycetota bacterium]